MSTSEQDPHNHNLPPDDGESPTDIRRVGRKDRKARLGSSLGMFPPEMAVPHDSITKSDSKLLSTPPEERFPPIPTATARPARRDSQKNLRPRATTDEQPMAKAKKRRRAARQNRIALLFFIATVMVIAYFVHLWIDPYSPLNPLAPARPVIFVTATPAFSDAAGGVPVAYPFRLESPVQYSAGSQTDCQTLDITGIIRARPGEMVAVRATNSTRDDGVMAAPRADGSTGAIFTFALPITGEAYGVQLFDIQGNALSDVVQVEASPSCDANFALVSFVPAP
jgi:hypothetical protein